MFVWLFLVGWTEQEKACLRNYKIMGLACSHLGQFQSKVCIRWGINSSGSDGVQAPIEAALEYRLHHMLAVSTHGVTYILLFSVSNKWFHERGQEFRRPCGLTEVDWSLTHTWNKHKHTLSLSVKCLHVGNDAAQTQILHVIYVFKWRKYDTACEPEYYLMQISFSLIPIWSFDFRIKFRNVLCMYSQQG